MGHEYLEVSGILWAEDIERSITFVELEVGLELNADPEVQK